MPVKPLELDDRTFTDLFNEVRSLIPRHAPSWTNHNVSDPGIMLVELLAWLTEAMLYRINRVSDTSRMRLLELLGAAFRPAQPAVLSVRVRRLGGSGPFTLDAGTQVWGRPRGSGAPGAVVPRVPFEVMRSVLFTPDEPARTVRLRQVQPMRNVVLARPNAGRPFELIPVSGGPVNAGARNVGGPTTYLVLPPEPRPRPPQVTVGGDSWRWVSSLRNDQGDDRRSAYKPWLNAIAFGGGDETGAAPPEGAEIRVTYRNVPDPRAFEIDRFKGTGKPWQVCRLSRPLLALDLQDPHELEPRLEARERGSEQWLPWGYVTRFLDMAAGEAQYTFESWFNAIRCGSSDSSDGDPKKRRYGRALPDGAEVRFSGGMTLGMEGNLPRDSEFGGWPVSQDSRRDPWRLTVKGWEGLSPGSNPTVLDEARLQVLAMLRPDWRTVTADDFAAVLRAGDPYIARVVCLPDQAPVDAEHGEPGDVGLIVIPDRAAELTAAARDLDCILATAPATRRLLAFTANGELGLWDFDTGEAVKRLPAGLTLAGSFSPDGRRLLTEDASAAMLLDARTLELLSAEARSNLASLQASAPSPVRAGGRPALRRARFSPTGHWWVSLEQDEAMHGAHLRDIDDGATLRRLPGVHSWEQLAFAPGDARLAVPATDKSDAVLEVWNLDGDAAPRRLPLPAPATAVVFSADGTTLAAATGETVRTWRTVPGQPVRHVDIRLPAADPRTALLLSPDGTRLVTFDEAGQAARLWSTRTGKALADLSAGGVSAASSSAVILLALSTNGRWLATAYADTAVRLWSAVTGARVDEMRSTGSVSALAFAGAENSVVPAAQACARLIIIATPGPHAVQPWDLDPATGRLTARPDIPSTVMPVVHTSGRWLAYADPRLVHVWDIGQAADVAALYADFDESDVIADGWELEAADDLPSSRLGLGAATGPMARPTATRFLRILSAGSTEPNARRTVQLWDAEYVYAARTLVDERRLITTHAHTAGPSYEEVKVEIVVQAMPATNANRLEQSARKALARFFDPLHGGPDGTGWPLGRPVYNSEICQVVEAVAGVDFVDSVCYSNGTEDHPCGANCRGISPHSLVKADVTVRVETGDDYA